MSNDKQATEVRTYKATSAEEKDLPQTMSRARFVQWETTDLAQRFAVALLANPRLDQLLGADPFNPGRVGDSKNAGEHLARQTHRLARQYLETLKQLTAGE